MKKLEMFIDGACKGNPGPAGIGIAVYENGELIKEFSSSIGDATNNIAEYSALVFALTQALILKADELKVTTDSELVYKQVTGQYKIKNDKLKFLNSQAQSLKSLFKKFDITHVLREKNKVADKLATQAVKEQATVVASAS